MNKNFFELMRIAAELFPPFIGLISWKYRVPASSFYHSLSVSALARGLASLLTNDDDEIELASYTGLLHDYYQKGASVGLSAEKSRLIIEKVLDRAGVDRKIVRDVEESVRYNVCENPEIWTVKHPEASLSMWLADTVAGAVSAFQIEENIALRSSRLGEEQRKLLDSLHIAIVSITIPQVYLRSLLYNKTLEKIRGKCENVVPVIARDGLVIITNDKTCVDNIVIDINDVKLSQDEIELIRISSKSFNER
ncbi:MAG: HD domain-containing protein, partial [Desulfurococcaceae archaeon]